MKKALHNEVQWVSARAPRHRPVFRSTYLGPPVPEIGQSNSRAAIIALRAVQWEAVFYRFLRVQCAGWILPTSKWGIFREYLPLRQSKFGHSILFKPVY